MVSEGAEVSQGLTTQVWKLRLSWSGLATVVNGVVSEGAEVLQGLTP